jgi:hypothetical protein
LELGDKAQMDACRVSIDYLGEEESDQDRRGHVLPWLIARWRCH